MIGYHVFYQRVLQHFGSLSCIQFKNPFEIEKLVLFALENPIFGYKEEEDGSREQFAKEIKNLLISNGPMLAEYFSLDIDQNVRTVTV
jgi:hypothetical protein